MLMKVIQIWKIQKLNYLIILSKNNEINLKRIVYMNNKNQRKKNLKTKKIKFYLMLKCPKMKMNKLNKKKSQHIINLINKLLLLLQNLNILKMMALLPNMIFKKSQTKILFFKKKKIKTWSLIKKCKKQNKMIL